MNTDFFASFEALRNIYIEDTYSNFAINDASKAHEDCSPKMVRTIVKGVLRQSILLDYYIDNLAKNGLEGIKERTKVLLRIGIYAIAFMDSIPDYVAVNEVVSLSKLVNKGNEKFINAILRSFIRRQNELSIENNDDFENFSLSKRLSIKYSYEESIVKLLISQYKEDTEDILKSMNEIPTLVIRCNLIKLSREELIIKMKQNGYMVEPLCGSKSGIIVHDGPSLINEMFDKGLYSIQSSSSIDAIECFSPKKNSRVLDMCAAPGGKTSAIAELMDDTGKIVSLDIHKHRVDLVKKSVQRLGITNVEAVTQDASILNKEYVDSFDFVLADVPCTGLGVISTKPEIKLHKIDKGVCELIDLQKKILENAYEYARKDGIIMYSTCTINKDENEDVIDGFIKTHRFVEIVEKRMILPYNKKVGFFYCKLHKCHNKEVSKNSIGGKE